MVVVVLRHGQTHGNLLRQYIGVTNQPLHPDGVKTARARGADHGVGQVFTSSLVRTQQTARILFPRAELVPKSGLSEMDFGIFEGKSSGDLAHHAAYRQWVDSGCQAPCPGGEAQADFIQRCCVTFLPLVQEAYAQGQASCYFVVHGGTLMALLSQLARPCKTYFEWMTPCCTGYRLAYEPQEQRPLALLGPWEGSEEP